MPASPHDDGGTEGGWRATRRVAPTDRDYAVILARGQPLPMTMGGPRGLAGDSQSRPYGSGFCRDSRKRPASPHAYGGTEGGLPPPMPLGGTEGGLPPPMRMGGPRGVAGFCRGLPHLPFDIKQTQQKSARVRRTWQRQQTQRRNESDIKRALADDAIQQLARLVVLHQRRIQVLVIGGDLP